MKKYVEELIQLINLEREEETIQMTSEIKYLSVEDREAIGHTITDVTGKKIKKEFGYTIIQYGRKEAINTQIKISDRVLISKDNPLQSRLTATVIDKSKHYIRLQFDSKIPAWALKEKVRIDLYINDITFKRMEDNLLNLTKHAKKALEYHLKIKQPLDYSEDKNVEFINTTLNKSQRNAIKQALTTKDFYLIHGPFGTGKTTTLTELILQMNKSNQKILVTAESNIAVDNLLRKVSKTKEEQIIRLGQPQRIEQSVRQYSLTSLVEQHTQYPKLQSYQKIIEEYTQELQYYTKPTSQNRRGLTNKQIKEYARKHKTARNISKDTIQSMARWIDYDEKITDYHEKIRLLEDKIIDEIITSSNIIFTTNSSAAWDVIKNIQFDVVIIDEASQTTIPSILIPIAKAPKFILAGDHKQLPPTIINYQAQKLQKTLFESYINKYPQKSQLLDIQYRMNDTLMQFPNSQFYDNKLKTDKTIENITLNDIIDDDEDVISFIDTSSMQDNAEKQLDSSNSYINMLEADICSGITSDYISKGLNVEDIGIITPYNDQVELISQKTPVEVNSVDGFQGRQKELIIISTVRSNNRNEIGFLNDLRRLNVAITRARRKLIIIGNKNTLSSNKTYKQLIKYAIYE